MARTNQVAIPQISLPMGGGVLNGLGDTFEVSAFTGAANLTIPVVAPLARDLQPELVLRYSSAGGNGTYGLGFGLALPRISRSTSQGIPRYDDSDQYVLGDSQDLVPKQASVGGGKDTARAQREVVRSGVTWFVVEYVPQLEGMFAKIEKFSNPENGDSFWQLTSRDNVTSILGRTGNGRIFDPSDPTRIFAWLVEETADTKGNRVLYSYKAENKENVPVEICDVNRSITANRYIENI